MGYYWIVLFDLDCSGNCCDCIIESVSSRVLYMHYESRENRLAFPPLMCNLYLFGHHSCYISWNMEAELQTYRDQLAYVNLSLESDPTKDDLLKLKTELVELIELTETQIAQTTGGNSKSEASKQKGKGKETTNWQEAGPYNAGMDCMAKYKDGKWYIDVNSPHLNHRTCLN